MRYFLCFAFTLFKNEICYSLPIKYIYILIVVQKLKNQLVILINVELHLNLNLPRKTCFYFTDITIPISFFTSEEGRNNMIFYCRI